MDNRRNLLAIPFNEIAIEEDRHLFIFSLLDLDEFTRREILHNQVDINSNCIFDMLLLLQNSDLYQSEEGKDLFLNFLSIACRDTILSYVTLCNNSRQQFIMDLLIRDAYSRRELLAKQHHEGENNLSLLLNNLTHDWHDTFDFHSNYSNLINDILNTQENIASKQLHSEKSDPVSVSGLIPMPEIIKAKFNILFSDPISLAIISDSWVCPQGSTYELNEIETCINSQHLDPMDRSGLEVTDLVKNNLFPRIKALCVDDKDKFHAQLDLIAMQKLLCCPLSEKLFVNPVVAEDGETYERENIEAYLKSHDNKTPLNIQQSKPLIPNRFITSLDEMKIKDIIQHNLNQEKPVQTTNQQTSNDSDDSDSNSISSDSISSDSISSDSISSDSISSDSISSDSISSDSNNNLANDNKAEKSNPHTQDQPPTYANQIYTQPSIHILFFSPQRTAPLSQHSTILSYSMTK